MAPPGHSVTQFVYVRLLSGGLLTPPGHSVPLVISYPETQGTGPV